MKRTLTAVALCLLTQACNGSDPKSADGDMSPQPEIVDVDSGVVSGGDLGTTAPADMGKGTVTPPPVPPIPPGDTVLYLAGQRHSPVNAAVQKRWQSIAKLKGHNLKNFVRLGDNLSHASHLLGCADTPKDVDLAGATTLQSTIDYFKGGSIKGTTPWKYERDLENQATYIALSGNPDLAHQEVMNGDPAFALVMFGTLEVQYGGVWEADPKTDGNLIDSFAPNLLEIVDELLAEGVLPLMRTIAPVGQSNNGPWNRRVTMNNAAIRAIAAGRQVPFADFGQEAAKLTAKGFWGDGFHLSGSPSGSVCRFGAADLEYGDNLMGKVTLEQMDRVRRAVVDNTVLDAGAPGRIGDGTRGKPFTVPAIPFGTMGNLDGAANKEVVYRFTVDKTTKVRAFAFDRHGSPVKSDIRHEVGGVKKSSHATILPLELAPGVHDFVVSTTGTTGGKAAEFGFAIDTCLDAPEECLPEK